MNVLVEKDIEVTIPAGINFLKFDGSTHEMSHCMKAVDFIIEEPNQYWFIEIKDPDHPQANKKARQKFKEDLKSGKLRNDLVVKYRDSLLYRWAENKLDKPVIYILLLLMSNLDDAHKLTLQNEIRRMLPSDKASSWGKKLVDSFVIVDLNTWNKRFSNWPIKRISASGGAA